MRLFRLCVAAAPLLLAACGSKSGGAASLAYYETYDPRSLDPALSTDVPTGEMVSYVFDGLTAFDVNGKLLPGLADRWTIERSGQRYVFHLRPGVRFHNSRPFKAEDVRATFLRVLDPASTGGRAWPLYPIAGAQAYAARQATDVRGIQVLGDTAVAFDLTEPLAIFPKFLAMPVVSIVPSPAPADLAAHPIGTRPWRFVAWQHDDYLLFAKNPDYWGGGPLADTLRVRVIPEPLTQAAELEAGRLSTVEVPFGEGARWRGPRPRRPAGETAPRGLLLAPHQQRGPPTGPRRGPAIKHAVHRPPNLR